ncbi:MAG TPA: hypothetical protein VMH24_01370 [Candidatus Sulfotelmatobacter sp.]|nr:hypothetical protein [Candidatus Sulfotelmatobacter sp.]
MPSFRLFGRNDAPAPAEEAPPEPPRPAAPVAAPGVPFDALTEDWRLLGMMGIKGRLSDALNKRESIPISDVSWAPSDGSAAFTPAPGLQAVDPYDLVVVLGGKDSLPVQTDEERSAHRIHKVDYSVALECPPFRIVGTVHLFPGTEPARLLDRTTELFIPVTGAQAFYGSQRVGDANVDVALVNRSYLRGVEQLDEGSPSPATTRPAGEDASEG